MAAGAPSVETMVRSLMVLLALEALFEGALDAVGYEARGVTSHGGDLSYEGGGEVRGVFGGREEDGLEAGDKVSVGARHLRLVVEVACGADSAQDAGRAELFGGVDEEPVEGCDFDAFDASHGLRSELDALFEGEHRVPGRVTTDRHRDLPKEGRPPRREVEVAVREGVEAPGKEGVGHGPQSSASAALRLPVTLEAQPGLSTVIPARPKKTARPLLPLLGAVFIGSYVAHLPLPWISLSVGILPGILVAQRHARRLAAPLLFLLLVSLTAARAARLFAPGLGVQGRWHPHISYDKETRGHLSPSGQRLSIPKGALFEGEEVSVLGPARWSRPVEGPVPPSAGLPEPTLITTSDRLVRLSSPPLFTRALRPLHDARTAGLEALKEHPDPTTRALLGALLFGHRAELGPEVADLFTRTGTRHLLAISGFHVAILAALLCAPLSKLFSALLSLALPRLRGRRIISAELLRAVLILTLVPLSGSGAPVLRAACAWALASLAPLIPLRPGAPEFPGRRPDSLSAWCLALLFELLADPRAWQSVSIQLSYAATLGLILTSGALGRLLQGQSRERAPLRSSLELHPFFALPLAISRRLRSAALTAIAASVVAVLSTTPIVWHHFGELAPVGVIATPLAALLITPLLLFGWLDLWLSSIVGLAPFHSVCSHLTQALLSLLSFFDELPATPAQLPLRPQWLILLACASTLSLFRARARRRLLTVATTIAWFSLVLPRATEAKTLEVHALDVGHGTCIVFRAPGSRAWIFDAGSRDRSHLTSAALFPLLRSWGNPPVVLVCSHADSDHARALPRIASRYPPDLWLGAIPRGHELACAHLDVKTGSLHLSDGPLHLELHRGIDQTGNEGSRTLVIHYQSKRIVLSGDAEEDGLDLMLQRGELAGPTDLLLVPHHGSDSPWIGALLASLAPLEVWVSCGSAPALGPEFDRRLLRWKSTHEYGPLSWRAE